MKLTNAQATLIQEELDRVRRHTKRSDMVVGPQKLAMEEMVDRILQIVGLLDEVPHLS